LANSGYFRSFGKFWVFVKFGHFCHMWQFLAKFVILADFDYVLILVTLPVLAIVRRFGILVLFAIFAIC